jgi:putative zinc finger/helix-turn-helix YgiT family protein
MPLGKTDKTIIFRGIEITFEKESYVCPVCGFGASSLKQAGNTQRIIADSYRRAMGLLTGDQIREFREHLGLTQKILADKMNVSIANIKKWEKSMIQTKSEDNSLRRIFENTDKDNCGNNHHFFGSDDQNDTVILINH